MSTRTETAIGRFVWHDHMSEDSETASKFYSELLGWDIEVWNPGETDYPMIMVNGQSHGGFGPAQGGAPAHWLPHVAVENADEAVQRAEAAGASVLAPPMDIPEVGRMVVVQDPQGAVLSLFAPAGDPPRSEGVFVWDELLTTDVDGAKAFYGEVVGWTPRDLDMEESGVYTMFHTGEAQRAGAMQVPPGLEAPPHWLTYLACDDVDATVARAEELGGQTYKAPFDVPTVGRMAILADPTGAVFGVYHPSES
jgi:predicted enzyme related to lactoylglutathione lyase